MNQNELNNQKLSLFVDSLKTSFPDLKLEISTSTFISDLKKTFGDPITQSNKEQIEYIFKYENHEISIVEIAGLPNELIITTLPISRVNCPNPRVLEAGVVNQWGMETYNIWINFIAPWWGIGMVLSLRDSIWNSINNIIAVKKRALCPGCVAPCSCIVNAGQDKMQCIGVTLYVLWIIPWKRWVTCTAQKSYAIMCI